MTATPTPDPVEPTTSIPYATPSAEQKSERANALIAIVFLQCVAGVAIFWIAGPSWPAVAALAILAAVVIALSHFITRRPI